MFGRAHCREELGVDQGRVEVLAPGSQRRRNLPYPFDGRRRGLRLVTGPVHEELEDTVLQIGRRVPAPMCEAGCRHLLAQVRLQQGEVDPLVVGQRPRNRAVAAVPLVAPLPLVEKCCNQRSAAASRRANPSEVKSGNCASHSVNPKKVAPTGSASKYSWRNSGNVPVELAARRIAHSRLAGLSGLARLRTAHQAMVTSLSRYTSCMEWMSAAPSAIGR